MSRRKSTFTGARGAWYIYYRMLRIIRRETTKAYTDMILFGSGFTMLTNDLDYIRHIPVEQVIIRTPQ